jgi:hypothetical protein
MIFGAIGGMKFGRGNRSTRRKPTPAPLCPPQIPHDETRARTPGRRGGKPASLFLTYSLCVLDRTLCYANSRDKSTREECRGRRALVLFLVRTI